MKHDSKQAVTCTHTPHCPAADARDAAAARIIANHLEDCGYALLCNGAVLLEGDGVLEVPDQRPKPITAG